jgi:single-strand DNA-binding protein
MARATLTIEGFVATELQERAAGTHRVVDVSVAVTPSRKVDGQWVEDKDKTVWYQATFWDDHVDAVLATVSKSSLVTITGTPKLEVYLKKDQTPGAKITFEFPQIATIIRKPKRGEVQPQQGNDEPWAATPPAANTGGGDVWNTPGNFSDETPF